jgi:hypothetical protein
LTAASTYAFTPWAPVLAAILPKLTVTVVAQAQTLY